MAVATQVARPPRRRAARWTTQDSRWIREGATPRHTQFTRYDIQVPVPTYDDEIYEKHLTHSDWTKEETDYLVETYRESNGKWPVIIDRYNYQPPDDPEKMDEDAPEDGEEGTKKEEEQEKKTAGRSMEDLKARFYSISASLLSLATPIASMTSPEYTLYETYTNWTPGPETSRKKLAEGHLHRKQAEVDEEMVLLSELQRIMVNQATTDNERDELRRRLEYPHANTNGYQYSTSQALTGLWQQLLAADRMKKNQRLRPTGHPLYDNPNFGNPTPTSATRLSDINTGQTPASGHGHARRPTRESLPSATTPHSATHAHTSANSNALPVDLSKSDRARFGVSLTDVEKSGVSFPSDKISKLRSAKSTVQADKIAAILQHVGVADLIPLSTGPVVEQYEGLMRKVNALLDLRKVREREEQEIRVREAEVGRV